MPQAVDAIDLPALQRVRHASGRLKLDEAHVPSNDRPMVWRDGKQDEPIGHSGVAWADELERHSTQGLGLAHQVRLEITLEHFGPPAG